MAFNTRMGEPEIAALGIDLTARKLQGKLDADDEKLFKKLAKNPGISCEKPTAQQSSVP